MDMIQLEQKLKSDAEKSRQIREQLLNDRKKIFMESCVTLFNMFPKLTSISWNQFTPYWCDGDTCTFSVHLDYARINGINDDDLDSNGDLLSRKDSGDFTYLSPYQIKEIEKKKETHLYDVDSFNMCKAVFMLLDSFTKDEYLELFGDHMTVTVTKEGITTTDFDHE